MAHEIQVPKPAIQIVITEQASLIIGKRNAPDIQANGPFKDPLDVIAYLLDTGQQMLTQMRQERDRQEAQQLMAQAAQNGVANGVKVGRG